MLNIIKSSFSGLNLSHIKISGADLTGACFDHTNLSYSNLKKVIFDKCYFNGTKFNKANLTGAEFGLLPEIKCEEKILCIDIAYNND